MHMPGHKRRALHAPELPWQLDITEIAGFDDLHAPVGILREGQERAAKRWGSDAAYFLINGSTCGILAGIYASVSPGDRVLLARGHHRSIDHAVELLGLRPVYIDPPHLVGGVIGSVPPEAVMAALEAHPDIRLAVITSPTYEGVLSDIGAIADILHRRDVPLLVDEAHGAHLGLSAHFPPGAVSQGADLVVQSLHKALPSLTQTALLHCTDGAAKDSFIGRSSPTALGTSRERVLHERLRHALNIFQTSSPSYPLLASIDSCVAYLEREGEAPFAAWRARLDTFREDVKGLRHLRLLDGAIDPSKLTILCGGAGLTGPELMVCLRDEHGIELEKAEDGYAVAMTGLASTDADFRRLQKALNAVDKSVEIR